MTFRLGAGGTVFLELKLHGLHPPDPVLSAQTYLAHSWVYRGQRASLPTKHAHSGFPAQVTAPGASFVFASHFPWVSFLLLSPPTLFGACKHFHSLLVPR